MFNFTKYIDKLDKMQCVACHGKIFYITISDEIRCVRCKSHIGKYTGIRERNARDTLRCIKRDLDIIKDNMEHEYIGNAQLEHLIWKISLDVEEALSR